MLQNGKSLNKLWREMGKPVSFKEFAEEYNKADLYGMDIKTFYHSATGEAAETTSATPSQTLPSVTPSKHLLLTALVLVAASVLIIQSSKK